MTNKSSDIAATPAVHLLTAYVTRMESALKGLSGAMGSHMRAYDKTLSKISGRKPLKQPKSRLASGGSLFGTLSQRQVWADAASAINKAMARDL